MRRSLLAPVLAALVAVLPSASVAAQLRGTVVVTTGAYPAVPMPAISERTENADLADQLFLRLAQLGPTLRTAGDNALSPVLAQRWRRLDPLTLQFEIDPRAKWQDGAPVTARDVVFTWRLATHPAAGKQAVMFEPIADVTAVGTRSVRVRFKRPFNEQVYLFGYNMQPLPSHLLDGVAPESLATSGFAERPVGNGPYVLVRRQGAESVELRADPTFFLGAPSIARVVFRVAADPAARLNLLLSGESDIQQDLSVTDAMLAADKGLRLVRVAHVKLFYAAFNTRSPVDTTKPHPILADRRVREALRLALDRPTMARSVFGEGTGTPDAAQSQLWSWVTGRMEGTPRDLPRAKALLAAAGWRDTDGDGILDKGGQPLRLEVIYPVQSAPRHPLGLQMQAMWREAGVDLQLSRIDGQLWDQRRNTGRYDIDLVNVDQDPTPSSLTQSWSCASAEKPIVTTLNKVRWCDPVFDRLLRSAETAANPLSAYRDALARMAAEVPLIPLAAPAKVVGVHPRYDGVTIWPSKSWSSLWTWRVRPEAALPRDR